MIITYKIPSGVMCINADEFFKLARRPAIRRMFKQLLQDWEAMEDYVPMIKTYLQAQEQEEQLKRECLLTEQVIAGARLQEARARYEEMRRPSCACYTRDKETLAVAKRVVQAARSECTRIKCGIVEAQRMEQWYKDIRADVDMILGD